MLNGSEIIPLVAQMLCALITIESLRRLVLPALFDLPQPAIVRDVWLPLILIAPFMFMVKHIDGHIGGPGWFIVGGPATACVFALATAALVMQRRLTFDAFALSTWSAAGIFLLLLGAAHHLHVLVAQCAFAIAALLMWWNTPAVLNHHISPSRTQHRASAGVIIALMASIGHGLAASFVSSLHLSIAGGLMMATTVMIIAAAARLTGNEAVIRIGGWAATYGLLIGIGLISLVQLMPEVTRRMLGHASPRVITRVAYGFGEYWIEAVALISFGIAAVMLNRLPRAAQAIVGGLLLLAGATLCGWRLARMM